MEAQCPCGSGEAFAICCGALIGGGVAKTAEALMRSRYSAFATGAVDYLVATHHPGSRSPDLHAELRETVARTEWTNLVILATRKGRARDADGVVEFAAACRPKPVMALAGADAAHVQLHERSRFVREDGRWLYVDGDALPPWTPARGAACWCGSGRKFKACCGSAGR